MLLFMSLLLLGSVTVSATGAGPQYEFTCRVNHCAAQISQ